MTTTPRWLWRGAVAVAACVFAAAAGAQAYPAKPIRIVVAYPMGGGAEFTARPIAQKLNERWGQPVFVESRSGGSAMIGTDYVAKSPPDGYTMLLSASSEVSMNVVLFKKMPYDPVRDLQPLTLIGTSPPLLLAHPSLPVKSVKELVALARAHPGALNYASIGTGSPQHFAGELMKTMFRIQMTHVPYKGAAPALIDMVGGHVPIGLVAPTVAVPHVKAGRLRALGVTSAQRSGSMPDVPTIAEQGAPGFDIVQWYALWLPARTPKDVADKLHGEINAALADPNIVARLTEAGVTILILSRTGFGKFIAQETEKWGKVIRAANIKPD